jgi:hypothetical protein
MILEDGGYYKVISFMVQHRHTYFYNPERDRQVFQEYVSRRSTDIGIELPRHRVVIVARKV